MFCNKCGNKCADGMKFCSKCGNQLPVIGTANQAVNAQPVNVQPVNAQSVNAQPANSQPVQHAQPVQTAQPYNVTSDFNKPVSPAPSKKQSSNKGLKIVLVILVILLLLAIGGGIFAYILLNKEDSNSKKEDDKKTEKKDKDTDEEEPEEPEEGDEGGDEPVEALVDYSTEQLINIKLDELNFVELDKLSYTHVKNNGFFESDGLADTEGVFDYQVIDLDGDNCEELVTFSIAPSGADGYGGQHDITYEVYEAMADSMQLADSAVLFTGFGGGTDDLANVRFMWLNDTILCADYHSLCCLEADGIHAAMAIYSYDGESLVEEGKTECSGSDWTEAGANEYEFRTILNNLGLTRTSSLMFNNDIYAFTVADSNLRPYLKIQVSNTMLNGSGYAENYNFSSATSNVSVIYAGLDEDDYVLASSASSYLSQSDISNLTKDELRVARNEIYARLGYSFESEDLIAHFNSKAWYAPAWVANVVDEDLTTVEMSNRNLIVDAEN